MTHPLTEGERAALLRLGRESVREATGTTAELEALLERTTLTDGMREPRGAFVSLKLRPDAERNKEMLRGCIGTMSARSALYRNVIELASKAALEDPRFDPLPADDVERVRIEISALTRGRPLQDPGELVLGRDGVLLRRGAANAVFLPQVAPEHGWSVETLLAQLARKAGLPEDGWREAELQTFTAEVFSEP